MKTYVFIRFKVKQQNVKSKKKELCKIKRLKPAALIMVAVIVASAFLCRIQIKNLQIVCLRLLNLHRFRHS